ncbi:class III extradiol ring-cleavage dioxygenase [Aurantimonas sp. A2-1-M11]|uniref:dioxygenase family protein n=1 Tax=Aurantimonas sp. A2-1-M11 TaxID=3113712 RepID=UPI002F93ABD3
MALLPTLFLSHGAPDIAVADTVAAAFLRRLATVLPAPHAILVASAHFERQGSVGVSADASPETIHDFGNFDPRLFEIRYPAPGDPQLAKAIVDRLVASGFAATAITGRGFDHGTWVPLSLAYPDADIPVVQVSVDPTRDAAYHLALGEALAGLRAEGVLIVGSGSFTHNLQEAFGRLRRGLRVDTTPEWVSQFADWMSDRLVAGDREALADYRARAPFAVENHPTDEHLMPLHVALGAAGRGAKAERLHASSEFGVLSMDAFAFH